MTQTETINDTLILKPDYDIVASKLDEFRSELQKHIDGGCVRIAISLERVGIIDSKGLAIFMLCHKSLSEKGGSLTVLTDNEDFVQLFRVMRMDQHFTVTTSL